MLKKKYAMTESEMKNKRRGKRSGTEEPEGKAEGSKAKGKRRAESEVEGETVKKRRRTEAVGNRLDRIEFKIDWLMDKWEEMERMMKGEAEDEQAYEPGTEDGVE